MVVQMMHHRVLHRRHQTVRKVHRPQRLEVGQNDHVRVQEQDLRQIPWQQAIQDQGDTTRQRK